MRKPMHTVGIVLFSSLGLCVDAGSVKKDGRQPISYNHQKHVAEVGMTCLDCHPGAEIQARASIPNVGMCGDCHSDAEADNPEERKVAGYVAGGALIPWQQIHKVPDHAYFSHRRHVKLAQIDCAACHGNVEAMTAPFTRPFVEIKMAWCVNCHAQRAVSNDCSACHR